MPYKEKTIGKLYWTIGEVADRLGVNTSLIRYWEKEFGTVKPKRTGKGDRLYTSKEIEQLERIQHLVKEQGFTLQGAKAQLRNADMPPATSDERDEIRKRLESVRSGLIALRDRC